MTLRPLLLALLTASFLAGCAGLSRLGDRAPDRAGRQLDSRPDVSAPARPETIAANLTPFSDEDEGSMGPAQDANDWARSYSRTSPSRVRARASRSSSHKPLYVRAYFPKAPGRLLYEAKGVKCPGNARVVAISVRLEGEEKWSKIHRMDAPTLFHANRTQALTTPDMKEVISWVPTKHFEFTGELSRADAQFFELAARMRPGRNAVDVKLEAVCDDVRSGASHPISEGRIVFEVTPASLKTLAKRVTVGAGNAPSTARLKPVYTSLLVPGARLFAFAAHGTYTEPLVKRETDLSLVQLNADKTCTAVRMRWVEPHQGGGRYGVGGGDSAMTRSLRIPCP